MDFILLVFKQKNITSAQFLNILKKKIGEKKMGHAGTLDKFAEGLLICATGKFTKTLNFFLKKDKEYLAKIELGKRSLTYDSEGPLFEVSKRFPNIKEIEKTLLSFPKNKYFLQDVPSFSAKKFKGKRLSDLARKNQFFVKKNKVKIFDLKLKKYNPPILEAVLRVSSGFYVRSFTNELGEKLKTGAYLKELLRTKIDNFSYKRAITLEDIERGQIEAEGIIKISPALFQEKINGKIKKKIKQIKDKTYFILQGNFWQIKEKLENIKINFNLLPFNDYFIYIQKPN